jgi:catechol-2,3-dioxygenase
LFESAHGSAQEAHESRRAQSRATIAFGVDAAAFRDWQAHLAAQLGRTVDVVDHGEASSLYFKDADGNPFEITCYA